jgi:hypothetical protein
VKIAAKNIKDLFQIYFVLQWNCYLKYIYGQQIYLWKINLMKIYLLNEYLVQIYLWKIYFVSRKFLGAESLWSLFTHQAQAAARLYKKDSRLVLFNVKVQK